MRATLFIALAVLLGVGLHSVVTAQDKPAEKVSGITIGEMRVQTIPAMTYLYVSDETTFAKMGESVKPAFDKVFHTAAEAKFLLARPTMIVYQGNPHFEPQKQFKMDVGICVMDGTELPADAGECKIRKTEPFKCASILYTGTVNEQGQAYAKLIPALNAAGYKPTGEEREMCLYWEGEASSNNVFMMMIGIK